jgi:hypothetical protein
VRKSGVTPLCSTARHNELGRKPIKKILIGALALLGMVAVIASTEEEQAERVEAGAADGEQVADTDGAEAGEPEQFGVGELVRLGDYEVIVHEVTDGLPPGQFIQPAEGSRYVAVDTEVTNNSDEAETVSTIMMFEVQDESNRSYNIALTDHDVPSLDGEVPAGQSRRGTMVFEVPGDAGALQLSFTGGFWSRGTAQIRLT